MVLGVTVEAMAGPLLLAERLQAFVSLRISNPTGAASVHGRQPVNVPIGR